MNEKTKLEIELVPRTAWCKNLRSELSKKDWDKIRKECYKLANYCCEICGGKGRRHPVECHEIWEYNDKDKIQKLKGVIALCPSCHEVKHFGLAVAKGRKKNAKKHLCKINNWSSDDAENYLEYIFEVWARRSCEEWTCDLSFLEFLK